ncbi:hypothetical protein JTE90_004235 [Oedothorax gibbosus]|uniref:Uncharacterized protein n=1 Tax=Oedothorax gibbosus TaxID=931172 RepID=A0AAV6UQ15_9ARAC|nr:hypothetical protein JTE90_004235 [Oedothorax gibbosus]
MHLIPVNGEKISGAQYGENARGNMKQQRRQKKRVLSKRVKVFEAELPIPASKILRHNIPSSEHKHTSFRVDAQSTTKLNHVLVWKSTRALQTERKRVDTDKKNFKKGTRPPC